MLRGCCLQQSQLFTETMSDQRDPSHQGACHVQAGQKGRSVVDCSATDCASTGRHLLPIAGRQDGSRPFFAVWTDTSTAPPDSRTSATSKRNSVTRQQVLVIQLQPLEPLLDREEHSTAVRYRPTLIRGLVAYLQGRIGHNP